ncbi:Transcriptional regulator LytR [bioreactor metagenome]|uniref:Transcriptional regulator LytR n=1 Tax=bioreactor metagenome TaxID=1076179 RepID=A0A644WW36_9ZZZZ
MKNPDHSAGKRSRILHVAAYAAAAVIAAASLAAFFIVNHSLNLVHYDSGVQETALERSTQPETEAGLRETRDSPQIEISALEKRLKENMESAAQPPDYEDEVLNILLIGVDYENAVSKGRSDSMILLSVNRKYSKIVMTSFMRDIYLEIPGGEQANRLNTANVLGGPALLMDTISQNFKISVQSYVLVDFLSFIDIIDTLGGITVSITEDELAVANGYIKGINWLLDQPISSGMIEIPGEQLLTGKQTLGYARIRYVGNGDFDRTARQRYVLNEVYQKVKKMNVVELYHLLNSILPEVTTNLSKAELFSLILSLPEFSGYTIDSWSVPADGTYTYLNIRGMSVLGIDFPANTQALYEKIYQSDD